MHTIKLKFKRGKGVLPNVRYRFDSKLLKNIFCYLWISSPIRLPTMGDRPKPKSWTALKKNQNNALQIINFKGPWESSASLWKESKFFKLKDIVTLNNVQFLYDQINKNLSKIISHLFYTQDGTTMTQCERNFPERTTLNVPPVKTITYVSNSVTFCAIRDWKNLQNKLNPELALEVYNRVIWNSLFTCNFSIYKKDTFKL